MELDILLLSRIQQKQKKSAMDSPSLVVAKEQTFDLNVKQRFLETGRLIRGTRWLVGWGSWIWSVCASYMN